MAWIFNGTKKDLLKTGAFTWDLMISPTEHTTKLRAFA